MARVYVSSTKLDLEAERAAVLDWLRKRGHVGVHSYVADTETPRDSCVADVAGCDAYVLILARRYGHEPPDNNPLGRSITELEYEAALAKQGMPILVLMLAYTDDEAPTDLNNIAAYLKVDAFRRRAGTAHRPAELKQLADLVPALDAGLVKYVEIKPTEHPEVQALIAQFGQQALLKDQKIANLEAQNQAAVRELAGVKEQLAQALSRTLYAAEAPGATPAEQEAAQALRQLNTAPAQAQLREQELTAERRAETAPDEATARAERHRAATLARERGALAMQTDVRAALTAYREAVAHEPTTSESYVFLGRLQVATGDLLGALQTLQSGLQIAIEASKQSPNSVDIERLVSVFRSEIGGILVTQGNSPHALITFRTDLANREAQAEHHSNNLLLGNDVAVSHIKIGDVLMAQGDSSGALEAFQKSLAINTDLDLRARNNHVLKHGLSVGHEKVGDVLFARGDFEGSLSSYRRAMAILKELTFKRPHDTALHLSLSVCHLNVGDVLMRLAEIDSAMTEYGDGHHIRKLLVTGDCENAVWTRSLSISHSKIGDIHFHQRDFQLALNEFRMSLVIHKALVARDRTNATWWNDLCIGHGRVGSALLMQGDPNGARIEFAESLGIAKTLAGQDQTNARWQADLAMSHGFLGVAHGIGTVQRNEQLTSALSILDALAAGGRLHPSQDIRGWLLARFSISR
jgi:tetratricopeptide (TPR) repeat protein